MIKFVIKYESYRTYKAKDRDEAIDMFLRDGHTEDDIISIEEWFCSETSTNEVSKPVVCEKPKEKEEI